MGQLDRLDGERAASPGRLVDLRILLQAGLALEDMLGQKTAEQAAKDATIKIDALLKNP